MRGRRLRNTGNWRQRRSGSLRFLLGRRLQLAPGGHVASNIGVEGANLQVGLQRTSILKHGERRAVLGGATVANGENMGGDPIAIEFNGTAADSEGSQKIVV